MISFACSNCGQKISVSKCCAGRKGKCPSCKKIILVPKPNEAVSADSGHSADSPAAAFLDQALFDIPSKQESSERPAEHAGVHSEAFHEAPKPQTDLETA